MNWKAFLLFATPISLGAPAFANSYAYHVDPATNTAEFYFNGGPW